MRRTVSVMLAGFAALAAAPRAAAGDASDVKAACVEAHEQGQLSRNTDKLLAAREQFMVCARDACPKLVRDACLQLLADVESELPTVIVDARDAQGNDTLDVRMLVDGALVRERLQATAVAVDPGAHGLRFESHGAAAVEQHLVLHAREKGRHILVDFSPPAPLPVKPLQVAAEAPVAPASLARTAPWPAYLLGSVALAGLGSFTYFAVAGKALENDRARTCSPTCSNAEVAPIGRDYLAADISLGAATVAAGALAAWLFLRMSRSSASSRVSVAAGPTKDGASLAVEGRF